MTVDARLTLRPVEGGATASKEPLHFFDLPNDIRYSIYEEVFWHEQAAVQPDGSPATENAHFCMIDIIDFEGAETPHWVPGPHALFLPSDCSFAGLLLSCKQAAQDLRSFIQRRRTHAPASEKRIMDIRFQDGEQESIGRYSLIITWKGKPWLPCGTRILEVDVHDRIGDHRQRSLEQSVHITNCVFFAFLLLGPSFQGLDGHDEYAPMVDELVINVTDDDDPDSTTYPSGLECLIRKPGQLPSTPGEWVNDYGRVQTHRYLHRVWTTHVYRLIIFDGRWKALRVTFEGLAFRIDLAPFIEATRMVCAIADDDEAHEAKEKNAEAELLRKLGAEEEGEAGVEVRDTVEATRLILGDLDL